MRKQLELILTALLPVVVLVVGFFAITSRADLTTVVIPEGATAYYGKPGVDGKYFGKEIESTDLCGITNEFEIYTTSETADVFDSSIPDEIWWYRVQRWDFSSDDTPWGTNNATTNTYGLLNIYGDVVGTFPWSGHESHSRHTASDGTESVSVYAYVTTWKRHEHDNGKEYICPYFYKSSSTYRYFCEDSSEFWGDYIHVTDTWEKDHPKVDFFRDPEFRDDEQLILSREARKFGFWIDCMEVNPD